MSRYLGAFIVIAFLVSGSIIVFSINNGGSEEKDALSEELTKFSAPEQEPTVIPTQVMEDVKELKIEDIKEGEGDVVKAGDKAEVNYTGTLLNGTKFDSSLDHGQTFTFTVGAGQVIEGWDQGLIGMKVGGKRKLTIPSSLGYKETGVEGVIPPNSTLVFEIDLVSIK